ncbi:MAG: thioredoxin-dependent thiol peroxidase [Bacteroidota bacterium]
MADMPTPGSPAPDFSGTDQNGDSIQLSDFAGRPLALYFYPKDDTPGCTKQACNLRDGTGELAAAGVAVVGVSADSKESHERFAEKHSLPFSLLPDPDHEILNAYGVWGERSFYGKKIVGIKRTTFLIGADGHILHVFKRPKTDNHTAEILAKLDALT